MISMPAVVGIVKKKGGPLRAALFIGEMTDYSPGWMASTGQVSAQSPQSVQRAGSMT